MKKRCIVVLAVAATVLLSACSESATTVGSELPKVEMRVNDGYIQYYDGAEWQNLISTEELRGPAGRDGVDGKDGLDGRDGVDGRDGADGKDGRDGVDGKDGKDAVASGSTAQPVPSACQHLWRYKLESAATYTAEGLYRYVCDRCGAEGDGYVIPVVPTLPPRPSPSPTPTPTMRPTPTPTPEWRA
ncbi:MAG: hypothetical protein IJ347_03645 [Faecalibacterium sp.]|nr:hypothetical protein [Faecalibacterium sp.]